MDYFEERQQQVLKKFKDAGYMSEYAEYYSQVFTLLDKLGAQEVHEILTILTQSYFGDDYVITNKNNVKDL